MYTYFPLAVSLLIKYVCSDELLDLLVCALNCYSLFLRFSGVNIYIMIRIQYCFVKINIMAVNLV